MTEFNNIPAPGDTTELEWNTGPGAEPNNPPAAGQMQAGYAANEVPASDEWNFRWKREQEYLLWLAQNHPRAFPTVADGIAALGLVASGDMFSVRPWATQAQGTREDWHAHGVRNGICTDGLRAYGFNGQDLYGYEGRQTNRCDQLWTTSPIGENVSAMNCSGGGVMVGYQSGAGLEKVGTVDGSDGSSIATESFAGAFTVNSVACQSDGYRSCFTHGNLLEIRDNFPLLTDPLSYDHGAPINQCCISDEYAYYVGEPGVGGGSATHDVVCIRLSDGARVWSRTLGSAAPNEPHSVCTDGDFVYVGGGNWAMWMGFPFWPATNDFLACLDRFSGEPVWMRAHHFGAFPNKIAVDDKLLWAANLSGAGSGLMAYDKRTGAGQFFVPATILNLITGFACDGAGIWAAGDVNGGGVQGLGYFTRGLGHQLFVKNGNGDRLIKPLWTLANPLIGQ